MLICIGGVCVPYTAVIPIILLALKWVATKLAHMGLLPAAVMKAMQIPPPSPSNKSEDENGLVTEKSATTTTTTTTTTTDLPPASDGVVQSLDDEEDFEKWSTDPSNTLICKFTATWCKPCHRIQPFFEQLSAFYKQQPKTKSTTFVTIDVDDFDEIATKYKVSMMPTFLVVRDGTVLGTYSGSNEHQLQTFLQETL